MATATPPLRVGEHPEGWSPRDRPTPGYNPPAATFSVLPGQTVARRSADKQKIGAARPPGVESTTSIDSPRDSLLFERWYHASGDLSQR